MPEFLIFAKIFGVGFLLAEVLRCAYLLGGNLEPSLSEFPFWVHAVITLSGLLVCAAYVIERRAHLVLVRMLRSRRLDLLVVLCIGIWSNEIASPLLEKIHKTLGSADEKWTLVFFVLLCSVLLSPLIQKYRPRRKATAPQVYFIADRDIKNADDDLLASDSLAKSFAETVLASGGDAGFVFGIDGPWGTGKTSFVNLAAQYWEAAGDKIIVFRFEPLRYASEVDLADRLIRELSSFIQHVFYAPEFQPTASRYSRMMKGKADFSFLGFKLSLEPSRDTIDELLDDVDEVLKRIDRRLIIVIDDLDRLDAKAINNVLFATKQTFRLTQATYILCYDTELLVQGGEDNWKAREFLEKFVTVKLSLFVDSSSMRDFLRGNWQNSAEQLGSVSSDMMLKLGGVLSELADILDSKLAAKYLPFVGNIRKVKRVVNAMLIMQLDRNDLIRTDFNRRDLINLILLHLNFPGIFRRIYAEETEGRAGIFSVRRDSQAKRLINNAEFSSYVAAQSPESAFLLMELFDVDRLRLSDNVDEGILASRACFNQEDFRNLENYLKLIVRFAVPEPQKTFILYQSAVDRVRHGEQISSVLESQDFQLDKGEIAHDQFWRVLVNQAHDFSRSVANGAIDTLLEYMPHYSTIEEDHRGLRQRSIYSLLRLLDRAGWGGEGGRRVHNRKEDVIEIARRIFGEREYQNNGILQQLVSSDRDVLGWNDLMIFRLQCSEDRQGQLYNLHSALIAHMDINAPTSGVVSELALMGMRRISQEVFALFKKTYIIPRRNFFSEVDLAPIGIFLGKTTSSLGQQITVSQQSSTTSEREDKAISAMRSTVGGFVIYQLSNKLPPQGAGVGCGYYDEEGTADSAEIAALMNEYVFNVCFDPLISENNALLFLDYCLSHLSNSFFVGGDEDGFFASKASMPGGLDSKEMGRFWMKHQAKIRAYAQICGDRTVITSNYTASYRGDLAGVYAVLDELANDVALID